MATTSKLTASNGYYGYESFSNAAANHLYVGAENNSTKYDYRSRISLQPMTSVGAAAGSRIRITKALLYLHRNGGGPTTITIGCSSSSAWNASLATSKTAKIGDTSEWYSVDITAFADAIAGYKSAWYIHLRNGTPRLRISGTGSSYVPYVKITWEYVAATITGDRDEATLGEEMVFSITPEAEGETHTLTYSIGDQRGTIAEKAGNGIPWTPPIDLATEFINDETGTATISMTAYNASGGVLRTEVYYQTLRAPDNMRPAIVDPGLTIGSNLGGYGLTGRTALTLAPVVDMNAGYGAALSQIRAVITLGNTVQELTWTNAAESGPGEYAGAPLTGAVLTEAGEASVHLTVTDSRGRTAEAMRTVTILAYTPPRIDAFGVERYEPVYDANEDITGYVPSDLGGYVWVNIDASVCELAPDGVQLNSLTWRIDGASVARSAASAEGAGGQRVDISQDRSIFPDAVDEGESWQYTLSVTDTAGESAAQYSVILPAHAALSISPDKYGVAIGMIAGGSFGKPMFEVDERYKAYFNGGLYGADSYRMDRCQQWEYLTISNSKFTSYSNALRPRIARVGPLVFLDGLAKNTADLAKDFSETIAALPAWARPATDMYAIHQGSGRAIFWLRVYTNGNITIMRYRSEDGLITASSGAQFPLTLSWIAADAYV